MTSTPGTTTMTGMPEPAVVASGVGATIVLFRLSSDLIASTYNENLESFNRLSSYRRKRSTSTGTGATPGAAPATTQGKRNGSSRSSPASASGSDGGGDEPSDPGSGSLLSRLFGRGGGGGGRRRIDGAQVDDQSCNGEASSSSYGTFLDRRRPSANGDSNGNGGHAPLLGAEEEDGTDGGGGGRGGQVRFEKDGKGEGGGDGKGEGHGDGRTWLQRCIPPIALASHLVLAAYFTTACVLTARDRTGRAGVGVGWDAAADGGDGDDSLAYGPAALGCASAASWLDLAMDARDFRRDRFGVYQRVLRVSSVLILFLSGIVLIGGGSPGSSPSADDVGSPWDRWSMIMLTFYAVLAVGESVALPLPRSDESSDGAGGVDGIGGGANMPFTTTSEPPMRPRLSRRTIYVTLRPYFWPDATPAIDGGRVDNSAMMNRIRAVTTWLCVACAKGCSLVAPIVIGRASTALTRFDYSTCIRYSCLYAAVTFASNFFKEAQSLVYLKVAQAAFVQLSEVVFHHLHSLSLDWHLRKKLGEVIRSMDRGISACDTLMKYLFLRLVPALAECLLVVVIFSSYFDHFALSVAVFFFVYVYVVMTVVLTLWRKKFRRAVSRSDNDWHDRCTDSLVNFETVKYFTAERYEMERFGDAVKNYQSGNVVVAASLSLLNLLQNLLLQTCLATALSLAALGIRRRMECCLSNGCDSGNSDCCTALGRGGVCPGMEVGDFVTVLAYTMNLFAPLNFLGNIYNAIVMAMVDLANLSELLAVSPEVRDAPDAMPLPPTNGVDPNVAVEFDNVFFHYPTQSNKKGLKGLSFTMERGTVTALVGQTGAGKTTVSRLLFRFYDVHEGAVKVNGVDVRMVSQKSLRDAVGVVPQATALFNDSIRSNILYGSRDANQDDLDRVAEAAQLDAFIASLPEGWETVVGDRGLKLSGGEKQRTAIARCLLKDPPFLILDEATSSLDTVTENSVQEALECLRHDRTCLVIAHRLGTIRNADKIVVLGDGKLVEQGTHDELIALNGKYAEMWNMQLHTTRDRPNPTEADGPAWK